MPASQTETTYETTAETPPETAPAADGELYVACYPYESTELGDLTFSAGEYVTVIKKDGDWWTGVIGGNRTGIFPSNYVQEAADAADAGAAITTTTDSSAYYSADAPANTQSYADDPNNQEEVDTEVSEINTQSKSDNVQDTYTRPMSTSSQTSVCMEHSENFNHIKMKRKFPSLQHVFNSCNMFNSHSYTVAGRVR